MKKIIQLLPAIFLLLFLASCYKKDDLKLYGDGTTPVLSSSSLVVAPAPADSNNNVLTLSWTSGKHSTDTGNYKYVLQLDSSGRNFSKPYSITIMSTPNKTFTAKELNAILLTGLGFAFNTPYDVDVRVISSYANNNEQLVSNTVKINMTAYKVPPKIPVPAALYIVGDLNGWNNNPGLNTRYQFSLIDETTYAGIFEFTGGGAYKLIQTLGVWGTQYHMLPGGTATAGEFEQRDADPAFPNPSTPGWYRVTVNFQNGTYTVAPAPARVATPPNLYIVGELNGWNNSPTLSAIYKFTLANPFEYTLDVDFPGGGVYKLIQELGNWGTQFHQTSGSSGFGEFEQRDADPAFPAPATAGRYKVRVNFAANYYWVTRI